MNYQNCVSMNQKPTKLQYEFHNNYHSLCELLMALGYDTKISKNTIFVNKFGYVFSISSIGTAPRNAKFIVIHSGIDNSKFHIQINKKSELDIEKAKKIIDTLLLRDLKSFMINLFSIKMREIQPEFVPRIYGYDVFVNKPVPQVCIKHKVKFEPENGFKFITELVTINMIPNEN